jgi:hypothetical protein
MKGLKRDLNEEVGKRIRNENVKFNKLPNRNNRGIELC